MSGEIGAWSRSDKRGERTPANGSRGLIEQYGVIAWRAGADEEEYEILLVTSRDTGRWVPPRGNAMAGVEPHLCAEQEAWEEAGIRGEVWPDPVGVYRYAKRRRFGSEPARVTLFAMRVDEELKMWPESGQRERRWFAAEDAATAVEEDELAALIRAFRP